MDAVEPVVTHPDARVRPRRAITGMSAVLLPHTAGGAVDWDGLAAHVARTAGAGLTPAVNMDTGFVQVLDEATRDRVLEVAAANSRNEGLERELRALQAQKAKEVAAAAERGRHPAGSSRPACSPRGSVAGSSRGRVAE